MSVGLLSAPAIWLSERAERRLITAESGKRYGQELSRIWRSGYHTLAPLGKSPSASSDTKDPHLPRAPSAAWVGAVRANRRSSLARACCAPTLSLKQGACRDAASHDAIWRHMITHDHT
jgi:hypothetical protein